MTTQINANLDDLAPLKQVTTLDGRTITINSFTVEPPSGISSVETALAAAVKGDHFVTNGGTVLVFDGANVYSSKYSYPLWLVVKGTTQGHSYTRDGLRWIGNSPSADNSIKEKLVDAANVDLSEVSLGDIYVTFGGDRIQYTGKVKKHGSEYSYGFRGPGGSTWTYTQGGLNLIGSNFKSRNLKQLIEKSKAPQVDLTLALVGDWYEDGRGTKFELVGIEKESDPSYPYHFRQEESCLRQGEADRSFTVQGVHVKSLGLDHASNLKRPTEKSYAPRVDISGVKIGDTLRLRDEELVKVKGVDTVRPFTGYANTRVGWFLKSGERVFGNECQDVIEVVPAERKPLKERIAAQISKLGAYKVAGVLINTEDFYLSRDKGCNGLYIGGYKVYSSASVPEGDYHIQLVFED